MSFKYLRLSCTRTVDREDAVFSWLPHRELKKVFISKYGYGLLILVLSLTVWLPSGRVGCGTYDRRTVGIAAELAETLSGNSPFTILGLSDETFEKLPEGTVDDLLQPENKEKLITILKHRVISNVLKANQHVSKPKATTAMVVTYYSAWGMVPPSSEMRRYAQQTLPLATVSCILLILF